MERYRERIGGTNLDELEQSLERIGGTILDPLQERMPGRIGRRFASTSASVGWMSGAKRPAHACCFIFIVIYNRNAHPLNSSCQFVLPIRSSQGMAPGALGKGISSGRSAHVPFYGVYAWLVTSDSSDNSKPRDRQPLPRACAHVRCPSWCPCLTGFCLIHCLLMV